MANEVEDQGLGPRKTMFVLVIVVGCFAVLWPRILSPLVLGSGKDPLQPNRFDREAGCCEVIFETEVQVFEILDEICNSALHSEGKLTPYAAIECRKTVNDTCGMDIAGFLKKTENVGKTTKMLLDTMKASNSSCLKENFGVPVFSMSSHFAFNSWEKDMVKQERPPIRGGSGPHPALRERGRAIPAGVAAPAPRPAPLPAHIRPPPIPGMRPPMGGAGGPVQAPKSSMGFVMPIYTICIIIFFVYTLSKILFKRTGGAPYEHVVPDPQFRRRVFRDDSRNTPDKLVVTAISGLVAEVHQQMEASYASNQQRQEQDNNARPYTNGTVLHSGPVQIVASEYREPSKEKSPVPQKEPSPELKEPTPEPKELTPEPEEPTPEPKEPTPEPEEPEEPTTEPEESPEPKDSALKSVDSPERSQSPEDKPSRLGRDPTDELIRLTEKVEKQTDSLARLTDQFIDLEKRVLVTPDKQTTPELLEEALKEDSPKEDEEYEEYEEEEEEEEEELEDKEKSSVKVVGMETTAHAADGRAFPAAAAAAPLARPQETHAAEEVKSIFLETEIPQQSRVLVADFADQSDGAKGKHSKHSPTVVSGKMTLSLIQDAPRDTPDRDLESTTMDDFTTASGMTQPVAEKDDDLSEEELDEDVEIEEIEIEVSEEEVEDEEEEEPTKKK